MLQEFDLEFVKSKSKKSLVCAELLCNFPSSSNDLTSKASIMDETLFLISSSDPWYGDIMVYLQTQTFRPNTSRFEQRSLVIHFTVVVSIQFCEGASRMRRLKKS